MRELSGCVRRKLSPSDVRIYTVRCLNDCKISSNLINVRYMHVYMGIHVCTLYLHDCTCTCTSMFLYEKFNCIDSAGSTPES